MELETGDILHCYQHGLLANFLRCFSKAWSSHSAIVLEIWGQVYIIDAQEEGVYPLPVDKWLDKYNYDIIVARPHKLPASDKIFSVRALMMVGETGMDFFNFMFRNPWRFLKKKWLQKERDDKMMCSEYVAWLYNIEKPYRITPGKLHDYTRQNGFDHYVYNIKTIG